MHLKSIKMAGFKSFVDPTVLELKSELVSVVGPNGCGKSNTIDAVRWVMGESSAKNLRGESMADVIFNGSANRKPVGQASVDLVFDNSDGTLGGEYASYAEIAIRREATRDGTSNYYLNGTRCRRKDIIDVFLGTGLGPRSYSIIQQGTVSRIIESKPEEMRSFIEEAAGISIYKKRRHETELRMRHTNENLVRLEDLRQEQTNLLDKLKRQSEAARKYNEYNAERTQIEAHLLIARWQKYNDQIKLYASQMQAFDLQLEEKTAQKTNIETDLEKLRINYQDNFDSFNLVQASYYEYGTQIARLEQNIQNQQERNAQLKTDLEEISHSIVEISTQKLADSDLLQELKAKKQVLEPKYIDAQELLTKAQELYEQALENFSESRDDWEQFNQKAQNIVNIANTHKLKLEQLDKEITENNSRITKLQQEEANLDNLGVHNKLDKFALEVKFLEERAQQSKAALQEISLQIKAKRQNTAETYKSLATLRDKLQQARGREASLKVLQQAALGQDNEHKNQWLSAIGLENTQTLASTLEVEADYQLALETVLTDFLAAVVGEDDSKVIENLTSIQDFDFAMLLPETYKNQIDSKITQTPTLASKVKTNKVISEYLQNIFVVDTITQALNLRDKLLPEQSVITTNGIWLGLNWVLVKRQQENHGALERENQLQQLASTINELNYQESLLGAQLEEYENSCQELESSLHSLAQQDDSIASELREASSKLSAAKANVEQINARKNRIQLESEEIQQSLTAKGQASHKMRTELEQAIEDMANVEAEKATKLENKHQLQLKVDANKEQYQKAQDEHHSLSLEYKTLTTQIDAVVNAIMRVDTQLNTLQERKHSLENSLSAASGPDGEVQSQLEQALAARQTIEQQLNAARIELEAVDQTIKSQENNKQQVELEIIKIRDELDGARLEWQTIKVRLEGLAEQLQELKIDIQLELNKLSGEIDEEQCTAKVLELTTKIERLGAINLAAIEEYDLELERKVHLDAQFSDLTEALETLESAIKKIDRETRQKFKATFDIVNANLANLFPKLFGGGKAYLEHLGDDLLSSGVAIMAMPPGKKNSSIHLLSGGEKALTAIALVFSIFQLNPSPFCMLDEVDAPLDDSNVVRLCNLLQDMAESVQFIIITHNKITMEISKQLVGVTMKEPGASRLVSVDINEAIEMTVE